MLTTLRPPDSPQLASIPELVEEQKTREATQAVAGIVPTYYEPTPPASAPLHSSETPVPSVPPPSATPALSPDSGPPRRPH